VLVPLDGIPGQLVPGTTEPVTSTLLYRSFNGGAVIGNRSINSADLARFGVRPGVNAPFSVLSGMVQDLKNPYAQHASLEIERAIGGFSAGGSAVLNRGLHAVRSLDANLLYAGRTAEGQPMFAFRNPAVSQRNVLESTGRSLYHAFTAHLKKPFSSWYAVNAHYTFSKAMDDVTDFTSDFAPHDQLNARADWGLSPFHQKHRLVVSGVVQTPAGFRRSRAGKLFSGWALAPIATLRSGRPFNLNTGVDNLGDRHTTTHRPLGAGRNIGRGPKYISLDARVSRVLRVSERSSIEVMAEGFNVLNRTNFKRVNNTVGNVQLPDVKAPIAGIRGLPGTPLSFTSAANPRQVQVGVRFTF
jgi:hypothetical protein